MSDPPEGRTASLTPRRVRSGLAAAFGATFFSLTSLFLYFPLLLFTLKGLGWSDASVGLVAAAEWLGLAIGSPFVAGWVERLGLRRAFLLSGLLPFIALLLITLTPWPLGWGVLVLLGGVAMAMRWIVAEATVVQLAPAAQRGRVVGLFQATIGLTYMVGPGLLAWIGTEGAAAEQARWAAVAIGGLGLLCTLGVPEPAHRPHGPDEATPRLGLHGIADALRAAPLLMVAGATGGFFEAGSTGVLPLFGLAMGLSAAQSALLLAACGLGGVLAMAPVGELADRWPHRRIYVGCGAIALVASALMPLAAGWPALAYGVAFVWGGTGGALYTLAMVDIGQRSHGVHLVNFTAVLVLSYTLGGMVAPLLGGVALSLNPQWGLALLMTALSALATWALWREPPGR